jgi:hypothetical protein
VSAELTWILVGAAAGGLYELQLWRSRRLWHRNRR